MPWAVSPSPAQRVCRVADAKGEVASMRGALVALSTGFFFFFFPVCLPRSAVPLLPSLALS